MKVSIKPTEESLQMVVESYNPNDKRLYALGQMLLQQIKERFATQGESGGVHWPPKMIDDGRAVLTGVSGRLLESFDFYVEDNRVIVYSDVPYAHVHQLGTQGKGGVLPTIRPVKAKALFIPLTDRARKAVTLSGPDAGRVSEAWRYPKKKDPIKYPTTGRKLKSGYRASLKKGKDFTFAKKVDIPPRPMLPTSNQEQQDQREFIQDAFGKPL